MQVHLNIIPLMLIYAQEQIKKIFTKLDCSELARIKIKFRIFL